MKKKISILIAILIFNFTPAQEKIKKTDLRKFVQGLCIEIDTSMIDGNTVPDFQKIFEINGYYSGTKEDFDSFFNDFLEKYKQLIICDPHPKKPYDEAHLFKRILRSSFTDYFEDYLMELPIGTIDFNAYEMVNGKKETLLDYIAWMRENDKGDADTLEYFYDTLIEDYGAKHGAELAFTTAIPQAPSYPELIKVAGGTFTMGDKLGLDNDNELPTHQVTLSGYYIGKTEVTVKQYRTYCNATGVSMPREPFHLRWNDSDPIINVSWNDAIKYCDWLSEKLDKNITLPTEAQWEFAARGGNNSRGYKYAGGNSLEVVGWFTDNSNAVHKVAAKKPNELGLYDMSGNVWEFCLDWYKEDYYATSPSKNPRNTAPGDYKVSRGGSWNLWPSLSRVSNRYSTGPDSRSKMQGFRVVSF